MARLYAATLFLSALLLFSVQPLVARMLLPSLGGTAIVWNTAMVFFQAVLLLGYLWAHYSLRWFGMRRQRWLHVALMVGAAIALPIAIEPSAEAADAPLTWLIARLGIAVFLPFFAMAAIAPMLQRWFARADGTDDPYWLYAASNLGSFAALIGYPLVAEPLLGIRDQSLVWSGGYAVLVGATVLCALRVEPGGEVVADEPVSPRLAGLTRARWVGLAAIPAALLISVTTFITTDLASVPLLWVVPLAVYLLSFVVVFARRRLGGVSAYRIALIVMAMPFFAILAFDLGRPIWLTVLVHLVVYGIVCLLYHGQLADERPPADRLTEFYIWMSVGGVVGGAFASLVAPAIFEARWEYPLLFAIAIFWLGRPPRPPTNRWTLAAVGALFGVIAAIVFVVGGRVDASGFGPIVISFFIGMAGAGAAIAFAPRQGLPMAAIAGLMATLFVDSSLGVIERRRSHLAAHYVAERVNENGEFHLLYHGRVKHGAQSQDPGLRQLPLSYYHPESPVGQVFTQIRERDDRRPVGVVGLGVGSLASYALPGQEMTFFEIDPVVVELARDERFFTFLADCAGDCDVVIGDGRVALTRVPGGHYQLLVLDAYSSDSIPIHLLTKEAMELYMEKTTDDGILLFHVSNSFLDVEQVVADVAAASGFASRTNVWSPRDSRLEDIQVEAARYVAVGRSEEVLDDFTSQPRWKPSRGDADGVVWTDDFANILSIYKWK